MRVAVRCQVEGGYDRANGASDNRDINRGGVTTLGSVTHRWVVFQTITLLDVVCRRTDGVQQFARIRVGVAQLNFHDVAVGRADTGAGKYDFIGIQPVVWAEFLNKVKQQGQVYFRRDSVGFVVYRYDIYAAHTAPYSLAEAAEVTGQYEEGLEVFLPKAQLALLVANIALQSKPDVEAQPRRECLGLHKGFVRHQHMILSIGLAHLQHLYEYLAALHLVAAAAEDLGFQGF